MAAYNLYHIIVVAVESREMEVPLIQGLALVVFAGIVKTKLFLLHYGRIESVTEALGSFKLSETKIMMLHYFLEGIVGCSKQYYCSRKKIFFILYYVMRIPKIPSRK